MSSNFVKSHSNYVLKTKHQETNDGIIYERDITTIGGRDHFAAGQIPIYKSGNFVITVNNENPSYKKTVLQNWEGNKDGDIWTLDILKEYEKDEKSSYDEKIVIKKDYYDLRDFAYYGSCSELMRSSINNIIETYPGELFVPIIYTWQVKEDDNVLYVAYSEEAADSYIDGNTALTKVRIENSMSVVWSDYKNWATWLVKNSQGDVLYVAYSEEDAEIYKDGDESLIIEKINYDNDSETGDNGYTSLPVSREFIFPPNVAKSKSGTKLFAIDNPFKIDIHSNTVLDKTKPLKYFAEDGYQNYVVYEQDSNGEWDFKKAYPITWKPLPMDEGKYCEKFDDYKYVPGDYMGNVIISYIKDGRQIDITVYVFMGDNNEIKYFVDKGHNKIRIRPKDEAIDKFYDKLSTFEKILVNRDTNFKAKFEIIKDDDYGYYIDTQIFTFPTTYGGYNLGSKDAIFSEYVERLVEIGAYYDENFSDNMWRSMTHEAIKNFDWTYTRHFTPGDEIEYVEGGEKVKKIIRLYGREFDEIRGYVDAIKENYNVTYDNINNLPDYFFTDKLEDDGWDVRLVNPLKLTEYVNGVSSDTISREEEIRNKVGNDPIERVFSAYQGSVKPYTKDNITSVGNITSCVTDVTIDFEGVCDFNESCNTTKYEVKANVGESYKDGYHDNCCNVIKIYSSENNYAPADVNSEFLKRFILNSKNILRHKGTIEGVEMLLSLFGMKSKNYVFTNDTYFQVNSINDNESKLVLTDLGKRYYNKTDLNSAEAYDFDIKEYTLFTNRIQDGTLKYDNDNKKWVIDTEGNVSKLNSYKLTRTRGTADDPYNGLPVYYRDDSNHKERYIYPSFQNYLSYDGGLYYQMNGGWLSKSPLMFDNDNNIIPVDYKKDNERYEMLFTETVKNVKCVQGLEDLFGNKSLAENTGDICEVIDLSGEYAVIDGFVYRLYIDEDIVDENSNPNEEKMVYYYFTTTINNNSLSVGESFFTDYLYISNPYGENNVLRINLNDNAYNGKNIRIYAIPNKKDGKITYNLDVHSDANTISTFTLFKDGKYMEGDNYSHYFRLNNPDFNNELSVMGWQQLKTDEYEYYIMNSVKDYDKGNNPHTGHMKYDKGHEYLLRFRRLFKPIYDNNLFDLNIIDESVGDVYSESYKYGFTNLVSDDDCDTDYDYLLQEDDKCHYFGDYFYNDYSNDCTSGSTSMPDMRFGESSPKYKYSECTPTTGSVSYDLDNGNYIKNTIRKTELGLGTLNKMYYGNDGVVDGVTNQIVNTKRVDIDFYLNSRVEYSKEWLEEVKYIDSVILPYVEQMLPSTIIVTVNYKNKHKKIGS